MVKKVKVPLVEQSKTLWKIILTLLFILFFVYFIKNEHFELNKIVGEVKRANQFYVLIGIVVTLIYLALQGLLYVYSFRTIRLKLDFFSAIILFLKRNLISVFIPAGTFSSLAFFNKELEKNKISRIQAYYGSYLFAVASMVSVILVAVPVLIYLFVQHGYQKLEFIAFFVLVLLVGLLLYLVYSVLKKGFVYELVNRYKPDWIIIIEEIRSQDFKLGTFVSSCLISFLIEITGIIHLYIAIKAIGAQPSIEASMAGYVVMVLLLSISPFLRGLFAIEVSMTYLLIMYNYSKNDAAAATLLFRFFEFWLPLVFGVFSFVTKRGNLFVRLVPVLIIFTLGIVNIISALTPAIPARMKLIEAIFSRDVSIYSNYTVLAFGVVLLILSLYMVMGVRNAFILALILSLASGIGHLIKAIDYEEASLAFFASVTLIMSRKSYFVRHDLNFQRKSLVNILIAIIGIYFYTTIGFYFLNKHHFGIDFSMKESAVIFFRMFLLFDTDIYTPHTIFARFFYFSIYISGAIWLVYTLYIIFRPSKTAIQAVTENKYLAEDIVREHGKSALDYFKTYPDKLIFFNNEHTAFLAYRLSEKYAVVLEMPVGAKSAIESTIREFEAYCRSNGVKSFYYRVPDESLTLFNGIKMKSLRIGQEAVVDLSTFSLNGKEKQPLRNVLNKITNAGYVFKVHTPPVRSGTLQKLEHVSNEWLEYNGRNELAFTQGVFNYEIIRNCTVLSVEDSEERVVAFANLVPSYVSGEATYDLMRKLEDTPNGILDFLMIRTFEYLRDKGYKFVNLGLAPLAGMEHAENFTERVINYLRDRLKQTSRFKGLYHFKDKFDPIWVNKYLVYDEAYDLIQFPAVLNEVSQISTE